jgi:hypothetical protein
MSAEGAVCRPSKLTCQVNLRTFNKILIRLARNEVDVAQGRMQYPKEVLSEACPPAQVLTAATFSKSPRHPNHLIFME